MNTELDLIHLVLEASLPVKLVMLLLLGASIWSWWIIFRKRRMLGAAMKAAERFEDRFWSGADLAQLYREISQGRAPEGLECVFEAGFREFAKMRQKRSVDPRALLESAQRAMRVAMTREIDRVEHSLNTLATVGSISPYVGLFGTVWGIMIAFQGLANVKEATIAMVAPGISEALIATAMGLFAAIPAVVFYNRYSNQVERLETRYDTFQEEFSSILQRQVHTDDLGR
ncbi:MAG: protein TolQ [Xanthomonadales bacterium]|nr:protein TolQ [Xanthomonadales bacterium]